VCVCMYVCMYTESIWNSEEDDDDVYRECTYTYMPSIALYARMGVHMHIYIYIDTPSSSSPM